METKTKRRGRKSLEVNYPDGDFNAKDLANKNNISLVTAQKKINTGLHNKQIFIMGKRGGGGRGRKFTIYNVNHLETPPSPI